LRSTLKRLPCWNLLIQSPSRFPSAVDSDRDLSVRDAFGSVAGKTRLWSATRTASQIRRGRRTKPCSRRLTAKRHLSESRFR